MHDQEELHRLHKLVCDCPFVARVLNQQDRASLKDAMERLINKGHTGYIYINVEHGNRYVWLA